MDRIADDTLRDLLVEGWQWSSEGRSIEALARAPGLYDRARQAQDDWAAATALTQMAWLCLQLGQGEDGLDCIILAKDHWRRIDDSTGLAHASALCSWLLVELGLVDEAFTEAEAAENLLDQVEDARVQAFVHNAKAIALALCRQDGLGLPLFERALGLIDPDEYPSDAALYMVNIGFSLTSKAELAAASGQLDLARELYAACLEQTQRAVSLARKHGDLWTLRLALCNGTEYAAKNGQLDLAMSLLEECEALPGYVGFREKLHFLYTKGDLLTHLGRGEEALAICLEAYALSQQGSHADLRSVTTLRLAEAHEALGNFAEALKYHKAYHEAFVWQMGEMTRRRAVIAEVQLDNDRLRRAAEVLAVEASHDALTGLRNRREFDRVLAQIQSEGEPFVLGILDLDRFKSINDGYSHLVGDAVLQRFALLLPSDQTFRLGGEEFAMLLNGHSMDSAHVTVDALRQIVQDTGWDDLGAGLAVTVSVGLAASGDGIDSKSLMATADRRLYLAKSSGRNRVVSDDIGIPAGWQGANWQRSEEEATWEADAAADDEKPLAASRHQALG